VPSIYFAHSRIVPSYDFERKRPYYFFQFS
jgi:hypothetical protein